MNGTVYRVDGEMQFYNYRIFATGKFMIFSFRFLWTMSSLKNFTTKDYTNYAIIWSCFDLPDDRSMEEGAIIGRQIELTPAIYSKIDALLGELGLNRTDFRPILHTDEAWVIKIYLNRLKKLIDINPYLDVCLPRNKMENSVLNYVCYVPLWEIG